MPGVHIDLSGASGNWSGKTDDRGLCDATGVSPGWYDIEIRKENYSTHIRRQWRAGEWLVLRLQRGNAIAGRVIDDAGRPVDGAPLTAVRQAGGREGASERVGDPTMSASDGSFRIHSLPPGRYTIAVVPSGSAPIYAPGVSKLSAAQWFDVAGGAEVRGADIRLASGREHARLDRSAFEPKGGSNP